jgi:hypothetical protein
MLTLTNAQNESVLKIRIRSFGHGGFYFVVSQQGLIKWY